jgi:hypothetical protein
MPNSVSRAALRAAVTVLLAAPVDAQVGTSVGLAAGTITGDGCAAGPQAGASLARRLSERRLGLPLGLRFEGTYGRCRRSPAADAPPDGFRVGTVTANTTLELKRVGVRSYLLAGAGGYFGQGLGGHPGVNGGGGVLVPLGPASRRALLAEVRMHAFRGRSGAPRFQTLTLGLQF